MVIVALAKKYHQEFIDAASEKEIFFFTKMQASATVAMIYVMGISK